MLSRPAVVLDASAGVEMALVTELGTTLAEHIEEADEVVVPDHFHLEAAAAIRRLELRGALDSAGAQDAFNEVLSLGVRRIDTWGLLAAAWELRQNVTAIESVMGQVGEPTGQRGVAIGWMSAAHWRALGGPSRAATATSPRR